MPLDRVTHNMIANTFQADLSEIFGRLQKVHEQLSSGRRIRRPSDDPPAVIQAVSLRSALQLNDQFLRTINLSKTWMDTSEGALAVLTNALARARELAVQGANGTLTTADRQNIGKEVDQLLGAAVSATNTSSVGAYIFAGHKTTTTPFAVAASVVTYSGDAGQMSREIGSGLQLAINVTGDVPTASLKSVLEALVLLRDDLNAGNQVAVAADLGTVDTAIETVLRLRAEVGAKINRFDFTEERLQDVQLALTRLLSETQDVDMAETITRFQLEENVYKAALNAGSRAIQPSLLDFMR